MQLGILKHCMVFANFEKEFVMSALKFLNPFLLTIVSRTSFTFNTRCIGEVFNQRLVISSVLSQAKIYSMILSLYWRVHVVSKLPTIATVYFHDELNRLSWSWQDLIQKAAKKNLYIWRISLQFQSFITIPSRKRVEAAKEVSKQCSCCW